MKIYLKTIKYLQEILLGISIILMMVLPILIVFHSDLISSSANLKLYDLSQYFLFFVMMIRPLADIFSGVRWIRPLVILRKGTGVFSASIVVSFILAKLMIDPSGYLSSFGTLKYWSFANYALFAHLADISAVILIITSNNLSKRILGTLWKKVQKLSYIYFYGSVLYVYLSYRNINVLYSLILVTSFTYLAFMKNKRRREQNNI